MKLIFCAAVCDEPSAHRVEALAKEIWMDHYIPIVGKAQIEYMLNRFQSKGAILKQITEGYSYYLLKGSGDQIIGYIAFVPLNHELFLSKFYIRTQDRRKGYGRQAMNFIENEAKKLRLSKITLTVNKKNIHSIHVYQKLGFSIREELIQDIGHGFVLDDYRMEKMV